MPKVGKDWKCDLCGADADYKDGQFFCTIHWDEHLQQQYEIDWSKYGHRDNAV